MSEVITFFKNLNFDRLLSVISCITGIIALFVGSAAYHKCQVYKKSFNDKKELNDNSQDNSQKAGRDIVNNSCDVNSLVTLTSENFDVSLKRAYEHFDQKATDNLYRIIEETKKIIQESKIDFSGYTKVDWINLYFESAKNTSDEYMQNVWARVLAKEIEKPDSFSYKTLDILKSMSSDDFKLFEKMCSLEVENYLLRKGSLYRNHGLSWIDTLKLNEYGLIFLEPSERTYTVPPKGYTHIVYKDKYLLLMKNELTEEANYKIEARLLSSSALELVKIVNISADNEFIIEFAKELKANSPSGLKISLHMVRSFSPLNIEFDEKSLL